MNIIATIGPSSMRKETIHNLINSGVNIMRLNFSHFDDIKFKSVLKYIQEENITIIADLSGKKIRVYEGIKDVFKVENGEEVFFCGYDTYNILIDSNTDIKIIPLNISYSQIIENNIEDIWMKDGTMHFKVQEQEKGFLKAKVIKNGVIRGGKGCNIPNFNRENLSISDKDKKDIEWAINNNINIICQSYVENIKDILEVKNHIQTINNKKIVKIYGKIETNLGVSCIKDIINHVDGFVIGRGDLVTELGLINSVEEEFRAIECIKKVSKSKDIIIATHLLNSMKNGKDVTLQEVESIYTFIKQGVNGFMLAGETSITKNSIEIVNYLKKVIDAFTEIKG